MILQLILAIIVSAQLDSTELMLGDQCQLHLNAQMSKDESVQFPVYDNLLTDGIEIVDRTGIDTTTRRDGTMSLHQSLTITSFQDSLFFIEPQRFLAGDDTLLTEGLVLNVVQPFVIDSTENAITDIKPVYKAPFYWVGLLLLIALLLVVAGLAVGVYFLVRYLKKRKSTVIEEVSPELLRPADEVAIEKLDKIKEQKIWQQGRHKDYHTCLTDVVREYIARRFEISSQEQTSEEILADIGPMLAERKDLYQSLREMLRLADLVKFAKWNPLPDENEQSLRSAYEFVYQTTPQVDDAKEAETNSKKENE